VRVVLDANVFISGVFFTGPPYQILDAWRHGRLQLIISADILDEYQRVSKTLAKEYSQVDPAPIMALLAVEAEMISPPRLPEQVCHDPEDDKFLACALAAKTGLVISGDMHLLRVSGYRGIEVIRPREFVNRYL